MGKRLLKPTLLFSGLLFFSLHKVGCAQCLGIVRLKMANVVSFSLCLFLPLNIYEYHLLHYRKLALTWLLFRGKHFTNMPHRYHHCVLWLIIHHCFAGYKWHPSEAAQRICDDSSLSFLHGARLYLNFGLDIISPTFHPHYLCSVNSFLYWVLFLGFLFDLKNRKQMHRWRRV